MAHIDQYAVELCLALVIRNILQGVKQFFQILLIGRIFAGIAGRIDARCAAKGVHRQTRVISNGRQSGNLRGMTRLQNGILNKRQPGLFCRINTQIRLGNDIKSEITQKRGEFTHFTGIAGREDNFLHGIPNQLAPQFRAGSVADE